MDTSLQDLRFAIRTLRKAPGFFAAVTMTIAIGVGATTAIFTVVDRIVIRPLPFPDSNRVIALCETNPRVADRCVASAVNVADWGASVPALEAVGVSRSEPMMVVNEGRTSHILAGISTPGFFRALSIEPALGRLFQESDLNLSTNHVLIVTDEFWRQELNGRRDAVGSFLTVDGNPYRLIGVLPAGVYIPTNDAVQAWKPLTASVDNTSNRQWRGFAAVGKLARGKTMAELEAQLNIVRARLADDYPQSNSGWGIRFMSIRDYVIGSTNRTLWLFFVGVGFVLAIACVNVASLVAVRGSTRTTEFAIRASLGAGRGRLVRQLLTESSVLAMAGGAVGWLLAVGATRVFVSIAPAEIPRLSEVSMDWRIALFTIGLTVVAALLFGLAPVWGLFARSRRSRQHDASGFGDTELAAALKPVAQVGRDRRRMQSVLVILELALSVMLLMATSLLARSFARLLAWEPGFDRSGVTVTRAVVPQTPGVSPVLLLERLRDQVAAIPGVTAVGLGSSGPLFGGAETGALKRKEQTETAGDAPIVTWYDVDQYYLGALGRRLLRGRNFDARDVNGAPLVALVNESFVARHFPGTEPLGQSVTVMNHSAEIVGVVADVRPTRPDVAVPSELFWPIRQYPRGSAFLVLRSAKESTQLDQAIKESIALVDPRIQVASLTAIERTFERTLLNPRFNVLLIGSFALVAIVLAAIGIHGVLAYSVARRHREIGLRIALGALPQRMLIEVIGRAMRFAVIGGAIGVVLSLIFGRVLTAWLYGLSSTDPVALAATIVGVLSVGLVAGYVPARRATRVDPIAALRAQ